MPPNTQRQPNTTVKSPLFPYIHTRATHMDFSIVYNEPRLDEPSKAILVLVHG